jgi:hypothetical protein
MIKHGWEAGTKEALPVAEHALSLIEAEIEKRKMLAYWDVAGSEVDVGRFVAGVPENMIEFEPFKVSQAGRIVTLCASFIYSYGVSVEQILRRGAAVVGLAMALEESQHPVEIWIDHTSSCVQTVVSTKVLLKGANDSIDPAMLAYQLAHPSILRKIMFAHEHNLPEPYFSDQGVNGSYGMPSACIENLPEGTIYIDHMHLSDERVNRPEEFVTGKLRDLGLIDPS